MDIINCGKTEMWSVVGSEDYEKRAFKAEKPGYVGINDSEKKLVATLAEINAQGDDQIWSSRHSHDLNFGLKPEARYFNPDGTTNPNALLKKGLTTITISKAEHTNNDVAYLKASGTEDEWGITGSISLRKLLPARVHTRQAGFRFSAPQTLITPPTHTHTRTLTHNRRGGGCRFQPHEEDQEPHGRGAQRLQPVRDGQGRRGH